MAKPALQCNLDPANRRRVFYEMRWPEISAMNDTEGSLISDQRQTPGDEKTAVHAEVLAGCLPIDGTVSTTPAVVKSCPVVELIMFGCGVG